MRYVFFATGDWQGNASMMRLRELGREMIARGVDVTYAVDDFEYNKTNLGVDPKANVVFTPRAQKASALWRRRRTLRDLKPDFVHALNPAPKSCAGLWGSRLRLVADWDEWPVQRPYPLAQKTLARYLDRWFRNRAVLNVVCSTFMRDQFRARYGIEAAYIPYATYLKDQPETTSPFTIRTAVYMGYLGTDFDHGVLFEAARLLKAAGKPHPITFIGAGPELERWKAYVRGHALDQVTMKGYVSDEERWRHLRHAHVLLFPIRPSPVNLARCPAKTYAYAEARRPVITCRVGEVPNVLGERATYVDPTPQAFADAIDAGMNRDQPDVNYDVQKHNWSARAEALLEALKRIGV